MQLNYKKFRNTDDQVHVFYLYKKKKKIDGRKLWKFAGNIPTLEFAFHFFKA